jgi:hypothetical protein
VRLRRPFANLSPSTTLAGAWIRQPPEIPCPFNARETAHQTWAVTPSFSLPSEPASHSSRRPSRSLERRSCLIYSKTSCGRSCTTLVKDRHAKRSRLHGAAVGNKPADHGLILSPLVSSSGAPQGPCICPLRAVLCCIISKKPKPETSGTLRSKIRGTPPALQCRSGVASSAVGISPNTSPCRLYTSSRLTYGARTSSKLTRTAENLPLS